MTSQPGRIIPPIRRAALSLVLCGIFVGSLTAAWGLASPRRVRVGDMELLLTRLWKSQSHQLSTEPFQALGVLGQNQRYGPWLYLAQLHPDVAENLTQAYQQVLTSFVGPDQAHQTVQFGLAGTAYRRLRALQTTIVQRDRAQGLDRIHFLAVLTDRRRFWAVDLVVLSPIDFPNQPAQIPQHYQHLFEAILNSLYVTARPSADTPV